MFSINRTPPKQQLEVPQLHPKGRGNTVQSLNPKSETEKLNHRPWTTKGQIVIPTWSEQQGVGESGPGTQDVRTSLTHFSHRSLGPEFATGTLVHPQLSK